MSYSPSYPQAWTPFNFLGLPAESSGFDDSAALLLPIPYEATTSYRGGTREGPRAIIEASAQVELYDLELGYEPASRWGIHTLPALLPNLGSAEQARNDIAGAVAEIVATGKLLGILGGEHSISAGVSRGLKREVNSFITVQLDAHADLRESYEGTSYSHASAARRILEVSEVVQLGIRSVDVSEAEFIASNRDRLTCILAEEMHQSKDYLNFLREKIQGRNVYLTLDVDVLDPSIMPSTGTPEPGGLNWYSLLEILRLIAANSNVIAFDCVELSPIAGFHAPDFTVAKLVYKIFGLILAKRV